MLRTPLLLATALVTTAGCAQGPDPAPGSSTGGGKADGSETRLTFSANLSEHADGPIVAGATVKLSYDLDRISDCRGSTNGSDVWGTTAFASFDGGAPKQLAVSRLQAGHVVPVEAELAIPSTAHSVALWFSTSNRWGCVAYDSNDGANYAYDIEARAGGGAVIAFDADWSESQSDAIHGGDQVVVHYAPERLAQCAGSTGGHAAWGITGNWQVDGGAVHQIIVTHASGSELVAADPTITVPRGHALSLWFEATSVWGCHAYDSDFGANYAFPIE